MADIHQTQDRRRAIEQRARSQRELRMFLRRLGVLLGALVALVILGTAGFAITQGISVGYGLVRTLDIITTLGSIQEPRDTAGHIVVIALMLLGIGTLFYGLATVAEFFVTGQLSGLLETRRTQKMIASYSDHYIICGMGRVGRAVERDLRAAGAKRVVVDNNPDHREVARRAGTPMIESDAADDATLLEAGIARAKAVIACVDSDAENIFITLTARELRSDILIIARASAEDSEKKLLRAGANRVISPYKTSGSEMARIALHPQIGGAVAVSDFRMEEIEVSPACDGAGKTIDDVRGASMIVALRRIDGSLEPQPAPQTVINAGDKLVALGTPQALERLEGIFQPEGVPSP